MTETAEPIAIVGVACRFPGGATNPDAFWQLLRDGGDAIRPIAREGIELDRFYDAKPQTPGRMMTRWGGFLDDLDLFDADFFGMAPREAASLDPSQRLLLETAWEACEDAAIDATALAGRPVGVFVGQWLSDFESRLFADTDDVDFYATTGSGRYASSGRLSFIFGITGPSLTVDTACSSSLVAVHLACRSLRSGESSMAIAAGVNVILQPQVSIAYSQSGMMAPDGHCKFGDADGDGYVRSEGVGVVLLKRLSDALADGDPIRAVIRGSAVNNDGRASGHLTTPSRSGQASMLRAAYADARVDPRTVGYVEAHGTGTRAGDPVELGALGDVLGPGRPAGQRCLVGSVKTNIGHTEGAAGLAGLIKCVLALQHGEVPGSLHLHQPNPAIAWDDLPFDVPQQTAPWPRGDTPRFAGVSAFGITGTNAHVVLEEAPILASSATGTAEDAPAASLGAAVMLVLSAGSPQALCDLAIAHAARLETASAREVRDWCATAARHRAPLEHRAVFIGHDGAALGDVLRRFAGGDDQAASALGRAPLPSARRVAFAFPGQGGQWTGMGRELLAEEPAFGAAIDRIDAALPAGLGWTVRQQLGAEPGTDTYRLDEIAVLQPTLLAVEIALAGLWRSWGVEPEAVVGHSMGEVGAAYIGGALTIDEAMLVICTRSALMQRTSGAGAMALLDLSVEDAEARIAPFGQRVCVAVSNGPHSTVVSGDPDVIAQVLAGCARDEIFARAVQVDVASHSPQMDPLVPDLVAAVAGVRPSSSAVVLYSTVDAAPRSGEEWDAAYWGRNLRRPVMFGRTAQRMLDDGIDAVIEVGPHPTLLIGLAKEQGADGALVLLGSLRRGEPERSALLASLGALWVAGHPVDWAAQFPDGTYRRVALPRYPWQRQRHWADAAQPVGASGSSRRRRGLDDEAQGWLHALRWEPAPLTPATTAGQWLLVGSDTELEPLRAALTKRGGHADIVASVDAAARVLSTASASAGDRRAIGIVTATEPDAPAFTVVGAVQALPASSDGTGPTPRLWWVTRGAHVVAGETPSAHAAEQGAIWGAARVVGVEDPVRWGGLIDLDPAVAATAQAEALADHLCGDRTEDQVALRGGDRYALRLVPADPPPASPVTWRTDAAYLITGGFGGVAQHIAAAMVRDGARRLVLMGRTALPPRAEWSTLSPGSTEAQRTAFVRSLEQAGAAVHVLTTDVADEAQVRAALDRYDAEGWPPIAGVIHTAAVLDNRLTGDLDQSAFDRVVTPKLGAALLLDRLLPDVDLFVVFSSFSAFWAQPGMASYTAANAGLDSLAQARRARGRHALSIQWGPWAEVGLVERADVARNVDELAEEGVGQLSPEEGTAAFAALLATTEPVMAVLPVDWAAFRKVRRPRDLPLFRSAPTTDDGAGADGDGVALRLLTASPVERRALLETVVRAAAGRVLRVSASQIDAQRPFGSMGLDSLMALELRRRVETAIERPLSATLAWNYPTVTALVTYLDGVVGPAPDAPVDAVERPAGDDEGLALLLGDLSSLSDDDAARALRGAR